MTRRNPPARIRWDDAFDAWGVTSTDTGDTILTCDWDVAIQVATHLGNADNHNTKEKKS